MQKRRLVGGAVGAALVVGALVVWVRLDEPDSDGPEPFRFTLLGPDLDHVAGQDLTVTAAGRTLLQSTGAAAPTREVEGLRGVTGLVEVTDQEGNLAGMALVPQDDVALPAVAPEAPVEVVVDYRTTAFALMASLPGFASADPAPTTLSAAFAADLPELEALADTLAAAAAADPAYLASPSEEVGAAIGALLDAHILRVEQFAGGTSTTQLRRLVAPDQEDADLCPPPTRGSEPVAAEREDVRDGLCITEVQYDPNTQRWTIDGTAHAPRWTVARVGDAPSSLVPGRAVPIPTWTEAVWEEIKGSFRATDAFSDEVLCHGLRLFGIRRNCVDPSKRAWDAFMNSLQSYFGPKEFTLESRGPAADSVELVVNGVSQLPGDDGSTPGLVLDQGTSFVATLWVQVFSPFAAEAASLEGVGGPGLELLLSPEVQGKAIEVLADDPEIQGLVAEWFQTGDDIARTEVAGRILLAILGKLFNPGFVGLLWDAILPIAGDELIEKVLESVSNRAALAFSIVNFGFVMTKVHLTEQRFFEDLHLLAPSSRYRLGVGAEIPSVEGGTTPPPPVPPPPPTPAWTLAPTFDDLGQLADRLSRAGLGCDDYEPFGSDVIYRTDPPPKEAGECTVSGTLVEMDLFDSVAAFEQWVDPSLVCPWIPADRWGIDLHFVKGNLWGIAPADAPNNNLVATLAAELAAQDAVLRCG